MKTNDFLKIITAAILIGSALMFVRHCRESDQNVKIQTSWKGEDGKTHNVPCHNGICPE